MKASNLKNILLPTGVKLNTYLDGDAKSEPIMLLHGFPESHRTWRYQLKELANKYLVVAPDQRGFAGSDKPLRLENYTPAILTKDVVDLADMLKLDQFVLVGHDWGGAIAWALALKYPQRIKKLIIINGAHPYLYQQQLFSNPKQRAAAQYINDYRRKGYEQEIEQMGWERFFEICFSHLSSKAVGDTEKATYLKQWQSPGAITAMLNWYRATPLIVPSLEEKAAPPAFLQKPFPMVDVPTLVIWGMQDVALHSSLLEGLNELVNELSIERINGGHFLSWEEPTIVTQLIDSFIRSQ